MNRIERALDTVLANVLLFVGLAVRRRLAFATMRDE